MSKHMPRRVSCTLQSAELAENGYSFSFQWLPIEIGKENAKELESVNGTTGK